MYEKIRVLGSSNLLLSVGVSATRSPLSSQKRLYRSPLFLHAAEAGFRAPATKAYEKAPEMPVSI